MIPLAIYAVAITAAFVITSVGGREKRDELRRQRDEQAELHYRAAVACEQAERDAAGWVRLLTAVEAVDSTVIEFPAGGRG